MSRIRSRRTLPELQYKNKFKRSSYQPKNMFGNPDFVIWKNKTVIFIDGCFWHKCPVHWNKPKSNITYWLLKFERNLIRDKEVEIAYKNIGWDIKRIWEHDIASF